MVYTDKEKKRAYEREYYKHHKEQKTLSCKKYYHAHIEQRRKQKRSYRGKHKKLMHKIKINGCAICGYDKCDACLDFHHVNPKDKKFGVSSVNMERRNFVEELSKCVLLCKNCHHEMHDKAKNLFGR